MPRPIIAGQFDGVVICPEGRRHVGVRLTLDCPITGRAAGDLLAVDVDGSIEPGATVVVSVDGDLFVARCHPFGGQFCFWLQGQRFPVTRATWGDKFTPVVLGIVVSSGRPL